MEENIFTLKETAQYLKISNSTIYKLIFEENLPAAKVANKWRIKKSKLDKWIDEKEYNNNKHEKIVLQYEIL